MEMAVPILSPVHKITGGSHVDLIHKITGGSHADLIHKITGGRHPQNHGWTPSTKSRGRMQPAQLDTCLKRLHAFVNADESKSRRLRRLHALMNTDESKSRQ
jgi:hypothetical protein